MWNLNRNKPIWTMIGLVVAIFVFVSMLVIQAGAQKKKEKQEVKAQSRNGKTSRSRIKKQEPREFVPSKKVSAGKSVSFPTDI